MNLLVLAIAILLSFVPCDPTIVVEGNDMKLKGNGGNVALEASTVEVNGMNLVTGISSRVYSNYSEEITFPGTAAYVNVANVSISNFNPNFCYMFLMRITCFGLNTGSIGYNLPGVYTYSTVKTNVQSSFAFYPHLTLNSATPYGDSRLWQAQCPIGDSGRFQMTVVEYPYCSSSGFVTVQDAT